MKKKIFSDNNAKKGARGFYTALGISAVMIGSACVFAYNQGEKLTHQNAAPRSIVQTTEAPVDKKSTDIPKVTALPQNPTAAVVTTEAYRVRTTVPSPTVPAQEIIIETAPVNAETEDIPVQKNVSNELENIHMPLDDVGNVLNAFSGTELVKNATTGTWETHNGTDYAAEVGANVYSISSGEIKKIEKDALWGVTLTLDHHNGYISKYCGLAADVRYQEGDMIASGDVLGVVGGNVDIESSLAPHIHIELTLNGEFIDPTSVLK